MRVTVLASGSGGNATLIQAGGARILVDAGIGPRVVERRMRDTLGAVVDVDAIVLTHPHGDHVGKVVPCARHFDAPVYLTEASDRRLALAGLKKRVFGRDASFTIGSVVVEPASIPHDAPQVALVFDHGGTRAALVTDLGHVPTGLARHLAGCQLVMLESNHDPEMLAWGPYPPRLKRRVASSVGHLSNEQAADLLRRLGPETRDVVLMHISETNNSPARALASARAALEGRRVSVRVAHQKEPLDLQVRVGARGRRSNHAQLPLQF